MDTHRFDDPAVFSTDHVTRRKALLGAGASGLAAALLGTVGLDRRALAQDATPMAAPAGWRTEHLEVEVTPVDAVTITRAGGGPPQRGDFFHVDAPIFAAGDVNGTEIGRYQCFGAWTHAADDTTAQDQRLTTVQFRFTDGAIMGLINEGGKVNYPGAVQGGTGKYAAAMGTFVQKIVTGPQPGVGTPGAVTSPAPGTPAAGQTVVHTTIDLLLPAGS
jgi:hypothetical protein